MKLKIYGASDDLLEIDGDFSEEFGCYDAKYNEPVYLTFSDGTVLKIYYEKNNMGIWGVEILRTGEAKSIRKECNNENDDPYSDTVELEGDFKWVIFSKEAELKSIK